MIGCAVCTHLRIHYHYSPIFQSNVKVTDDSGQAPITAEMVWAWVPKARKPKNKKEGEGGGGEKK